MDDSVEVCWDHDSPTPSIWRLHQAPSRGEEDTHCSPQLVRTKRKLPPQSHKPSDDYPRFEQSRKEANQIINQLRRASREGEASQTGVNVERRLVIPELPEEEESDDDRTVQTVPFKDCRPNTSLDVIFDMSGNGEEELASTSRSSNTVRKSANERSADEWTDDDIFNNDVLMSQVDQVAKITPAKTTKQPYNRHLSAAQRTSTPSNAATKNSARTVQNGGAGNSKNNVKGLLDFFMDEGKPAKPSPTKDKQSLVSTKGNYKFVSKTGTSSVSTSSNVLKNYSKTPNPNPTRPEIDIQKLNAVGDSSNGSTRSLKNCEVSKTKSALTKPMDTSIPLDVLEELIEDSWNETDDEKVVKPKQNKNIVAKIPPRSSTTTVQKNSATSVTNRSLDPRSKPPPTQMQQNSTRPSACGNGTNANPYKFRKTEGSRPDSQQRVPNRIGHTGGSVQRQPAINTGLKNKKFEEIKKSEKNNISSDGFSSDDEDMLLEAVALTESQQSSQGSSPAVQQRATTVTTSKPSSAPSSGAYTAVRPKAASSLPITKQTATNNSKSNSSSQPKCSASEIERKKRMAMERRMQRMREQNQRPR